jgi:hypothetical protein
MQETNRHMQRDTMSCSWEGRGKDCTLIMQFVQNTGGLIAHPQGWARYQTEVKMRLLYIMLVAAALLLSAVSGVESFGGNDLKQWSQEREKAVKGDTDVSWFDAGRLMGYVSGVSDSLDDVRFCLPPRTTLGQVEEVVVNYLTRHPESNDRRALEVVTEALTEAFPCKK